MSWIQENKFTASVLGATVVVSGALFYLGMSARSDAEETRLASNAIVNQTNLLKKNEPYPTDFNRTLVKDKVAGFTQDALAFQKSLLAFRPASLPRLSESAFGSKVSEHRKKFLQLYKDKGINLPGGGNRVAFGLEKYRGGGLAQRGATPLLNYELKALDWLFTELAEAAPASLDNVYRTQIAEELSTPASNNKKKTKKSSKKKVGAVDSVYRAMPIELTFTGTELSLRNFLAQLSNSEKYFFVTRSIRIRNLQQESPNLKDAIIAAPAADTIEGFEGFGEVDNADSDGSPVLKKLTGDEKIKVHLKLDLLLFKPASSVPFPGVKKERKKASPAKSTTPKN